jgi:hypothetical protein
MLHGLTTLILGGEARQRRPEKDIIGVKKYYRCKNCLCGWGQFLQ